MGRGRSRQRDLFDETPQTAELRPELRCKIALLLLQVLLTEAAGAQQSRTESAARDSGEAGDDPDHA